MACEYDQLATCGFSWTLLVVEPLLVEPSKPAAANAFLIVHCGIMLR
jgi:hypothetical protein